MIKEYTNFSIIVTAIPTLSPFSAFEIEKSVEPTKLKKNIVK